MTTTIKTLTLTTLALGALACDPAQPGVGDCQGDACDFRDSESKLEYGEEPPPEEEVGDGDGDGDGDLLPGCNSEIDQSYRTTTKRICADFGGVVCTPDRSVCLEIPPDALEEDTKISLTITGPEFEIEDVEQLYVGAEMQPHGLTFNEPVIASVRVEGVDNLEDVTLITADGEGNNEELDNIAIQDGRVTGELHHFSWLFGSLAQSASSGQQPTLTLHGGPNGPVYETVDLGDSDSLGLQVVNPGAGYVWSNGTETSEVLVLQVDYPNAVAGQIAYADLTMRDPLYSGTGPNAQQLWQTIVFNQVFEFMRLSLHPSGSDGVAVMPVRADQIQWHKLPVGYASATAEVLLRYIDESGNVLGTSNLALSISAPPP